MAVRNKKKIGSKWLSSQITRAPPKRKKPFCCPSIQFRSSEIERATLNSRGVWYGAGGELGADRRARNMPKSQENRDSDWCDTLVVPSSICNFSTNSINILYLQNDGRFWGASASGWMGRGRQSTYGAYNSSSIKMGLKEVCGGDRLSVRRTVIGML